MTNYCRDHRYLYAAIICTVLGLLCLSLIGCSLKSAQVSHVAVQTGDVVSTHVAESRGAQEMNPLLQVGWPTRIALKSAATVGILYLTQKIGRENKKIATTVLTVINVVYTGVIVNNVFAAQASRRP